MERGAAAERAGRTEHGHGDEQEVDEGVLDAGHVVRRRAAARLASAGARAAFIPAGSAGARSAGGYRVRAIVSRPPHLSNPTQFVAQL